MRKLGQGFALILAVAFIAFPRAGTAQDKTWASLSAPEILTRMAQTYASCRSYQDTGVVRTIFFRKSGKYYTETLPFTTAFVRPDAFRFEFTDNSFSSFGSPPTHYIAWRDATNVRVWWDIDIEPTLDRPSSLNQALAGGTGISGGSAHNIPVLLLPGEVSGRSFKDMKKARRLADAKCGDETCARIAGIYGPDEATIWNAQGSFLVRCIEQAHQFSNFRTERTTTYEPIINNDVSPALLSFNLP